MTQRNRRRHRRRGGARSKLLFVFGGVLAAVAIGVVGVASWVLDVAAKAPPLSDCRPIDRGGNSLLIAGDGSRLGYIASEEARTPVAIDRVPTDLQYATVAIEDERFFEHDGIDYEGGLRALIENIEAGEVVQGGSTITMQLMRNLCITDPQRNLERKIQEAELALEFEKKFSEKGIDRVVYKREILGKYLNGTSYGTINGTTAVGVQAASRIYFSKPVWKLTLEQSALLAGLPQAPSDYNPILNPEGARERRNEVLSSMAKLGYISRERALEGQQRGLDIDLSNTYFVQRQPYFFDYVEDKLIEKYGVNTVRKGGLRVYTTVDPELQEVGLEAMQSALPYEEDPSAALVAIEPETGQIKAMVSSSSYDQSQFNLAAQGHRQPGSTFKTFVLTTALKQGIDPYSTYYTSKPLNLDLPEWGHWEVATADEGYQGTINLQQATVASDNTVFAQLDLDVGPENVAETATSMGIETELDGIPAEGIGGLRIGVSPLELSSAYATLAAGGIAREPIAVRRVIFPDGRVDHPEHAEPKRVVPEGVAYEVTQLLRDNITGGTGTSAYTGCGGQAGKTGTTDNYTDAWFAGYQPNLATAVWVGYPQSNDIEMTSVHGTTVFGGTFPAQIWNSLYVNGEIPCEEFEEPETPVSWAPFYGEYTQSGASSDDYYSDEEELDDEESDAEKKGKEATGGYDPDAYAPGAGQEPTPAPEPAPTPAPAPSPPPSGGGGGGVAAGGVAAG
jgi:penicillin-binding protein 1A